MLVAGIDAFANSVAVPLYSQEKVKHLVTEYAVSNYNIKDENSVKIVSQELKKIKTEASSKNCVVIIVEAVLEIPITISIGGIEISFTLSVPVTIVIEIGC